MVSQIAAHTNQAGNKVNKSVVKSTLNAYFENEGIMEEEEKLRLINEFVQDNESRNENDTLLSATNHPKSHDKDIDVDELYILNQDLKQIQKSISMEHQEIEMGALNDKSVV